MCPFITLHDWLSLFVWPVKFPILLCPSKLIPLSWILAPKINSLLFGRFGQGFQDILYSRLIDFAYPSNLCGFVKMPGCSRNIAVFHFEPHVSAGDDVASDMK